MASSLTFTSDLKNVRLINSFLNRLETDYDILPGKFVDIKLSIIEAVNNAIIHGNKFDIEKTVSITEKNENGFLVIKILDQGRGFDHNEVKDPTLSENILNPGGRGIHLIKNLSDDCHFTEKGNSVTLRFKL
ncbi:ATP-binding protein [Membranihabitans marinus]|uniref:ATP-binding protein n=1 Tax=Membranihabitans marinus TaxID=1227546 RepID=UPI0021D46257|nr:ATP-binding protein [Membranihabitans marinus]